MEICDLEVQYDRMCRICLKTSENMKQLFGLLFPKDNIMAIHFIRKITDLKLPESETLPNGVCNKCREDMFAAFNLAQLCIASDAILRNQETRRMLRKIEEEALKEEEIVIKCELPLENENLETRQNKIYIHDEIIDDHFSDNEAISNENYSETDLNFSTRIKDKYQCKFCTLFFNNKMKYLKHQKTHDDTKPFECEKCSQKFSKMLHLKVHLRSHIKKEDKKYSCEECGQQFVFEYLLKQHEYKHSDKKPYPCTKCSKGCLTAESLRRHLKIHDEHYTKKTHICYICSKSFAYPSFLAEHMKNHTGEKPHLCSICGKGFRQSGALHYHQRIHTGYKPFACNICDENFMSQSVLKVHMRKHTNERPYVCKICGMSFRQSTDLKGHSRTHTGEKPVLCTVCGKKMSTTGQLTIHLRSHTGEKPYSCSICVKSFTTKTILVKHERIHTGERPYVCDICGRAFNQSSTLRSHSNTHKSNKRTKLKHYTKKKLSHGKILVKHEDVSAETVKEQIIEDNGDNIK